MNHFFMNFLVKRANSPSNLSRPPPTMAPLPAPSTPTSRPLYPRFRTLYPRFRTLYPRFRTLYPRTPAPLSTPSDEIFCRISQDFENNSVILSRVGAYLAMISLLEGF